MSRTRVHPSRVPVGIFSVQRVLALCVAATMVVDAYVHLHDAAFYDMVGTNVVSQGTLFRVEAVVAAATALVLIIWPRPLTWAASLLVAASAFGAVVLSTYVRVGALGPLPNMFEPTWALPGKLASAWAEGIGAVLAWNGLFLSVGYPGRRRSAPALREGEDRDAIAFDDQHDGLQSESPELIDASVDRDGHDVEAHSTGEPPLLLTVTRDKADSASGGRCPDLRTGPAVNSPRRSA